MYATVPQIINPNVSHTHNGNDSRGCCISQSSTAHSHVAIIIFGLGPDAAKILSIDESAKSKKNHAPEPIDTLCRDVGGSADADAAGN
jgi:hypothetical protein